MRLFADRVHRLPRIWSNRELGTYAHLFKGDVVNVSGWKDIDKEGRHYRDYFFNASSYTITNFRSEARGFQGYPGEIFLDLEEDLPNTLHQKFDVVFNHTTLEHIYEIKTAFANLCNMSKDIVILILPFLQPYHADYGDYWRFSPLAIKNLFEENKLEVLYQSFNSHNMCSVYVFTIASRHPAAWSDCFEWSFSCSDPKSKGPDAYIGINAIPNMVHRHTRIFRRFIKLPTKLMQRLRERSQD